MIALLAAYPLNSSAANDPWTLQSAIGSPDNLKLSGSFRSRYEVLDGQPRTGLDYSTGLLNFRTTLFAEYGTSALRVAGELYDSRAYWAEAGSGVSANEVNALELVQAYVAADLSPVLTANTKGSVQAGRFTLNLGSRRLVAADDYRNTTNGYTGLRVDLKRSSNGVSSTLIYTLPQRRLPTDLDAVLDNKVEFDHESAAQVLWGGLVSLPVWQSTMLEASWFEFTEDDERDLATRNRHLRTLGTRWFRDPAPGKWDHEAEVTYQTGSLRASTSATAPLLDVEAYFVHLRLGRQGTGPWKPRIALEYDEVSGDDSARRYGRYDTLFGMRRADLAPSGIYAAIGRANLRSPGVRVELVPTPRLDALLTYRALWLHTNTDAFSTTGVRDSSGQSGNFAGHQLDTRLRYWLVPKFLRMEANAVMLFKGRFLNDAPNAPQSGDTHYLSLSLLAIF